jgi:hypothetical protein
MMKHNMTQCGRSQIGWQNRCEDQKPHERNQSLNLEPARLELEGVTASYTVNLPGRSELPGAAWWQVAVVDRTG